MVEIGLDMDGVLVDFMAPICLWLGIKQEEITLYRLEDLYPDKEKEIKNFYGQKGYFKKLDAYPGALKFLKELRKLPGVRVWFVSKPAKFSAASWSDKFEWIMENTPEMIHTTILATDKSIVSLDVFVEDDPSNLTSNGAKHKFLFDRPWNRDDKVFERVKDYDELLKKIKEAIK